MRIRSFTPKSIAVVALILAPMSGCSLLFETSNLTGGQQSTDATSADVTNSVGADGSSSGSTDASADAAPEVNDADAASDTGGGKQDSSTNIGFGTPNVRCQGGASDLQCGSNEACCVVFGNNANYCLSSADAAACTDPVDPVGFLLCDDDRDCTLGSICCATPGATEAFSSSKCVAASTCPPPSYHMCDPRVGCGSSACTTGPELGNFYGACK